MRCDAIMTAEPLKVRDTQKVEQVADLLIRHRQLSLPVVDHEDRYIGMFGADELAGLIVPRVALAGSIAANIRFIEDDAGPLAERYRDLKHLPVSQAANRNAVALPPETLVIEAFRIFCRNRAPLAVVDPADRKLLGLVTYWDVIRTVTESA